MNIQSMSSVHKTKVRTGQKARTNHIRDNSRRQAMVDVYNKESIIKSVALKTLMRFSAVARREFALPGRVLPHCRDSKSTATTTKDWAEGRGIASSDADSESSSLDLSSTVPTEQSTSPGRVRNSTGRRQLTLSLDGVENPSNETVFWTLKWMMDNAEASNELIPYAPDLDKLDFEDLVDFYQASLALQLLPVPKHISAALMKRVTEQPPTPEMFQTLSSYVPAGNVVIDCAIDSFFRHWSDGKYSHEQLAKIEYIMRKEGNEALRQRRDHIFSVTNIKSDRGREQNEPHKREISRQSRLEKIAQKDRRQSGSNLAMPQKDSLQRTGLKRKDWRRRTDAHSSPTWTFPTRESRNSVMLEDLVELSATVNIAQAMSELKVNG